MRAEKVVCVDRRRKKTMDEAGVIEKFGVPPASIPDWLALVGDNADGIPGVPRWGARSAAAALAEYGHIEKIPDDPVEWTFKVRGAASLAEQLRGHREPVILYRLLATLREDTPLAESLDELEWRGADRRVLTALAQQYGDEDLLERVPAWRD